ncbi:MAG: hypothetical protein ABIO94_03550 [Opitutaceae bacterium]
MKIPLLALACLGLVTGCAFYGGPPNVPTSFAIESANTKDPLDKAKGFTHLAFVIDTSGSMRDPYDKKLWPMVAYTVANVLATHPETKFIQWVDTDGRTPLGSGGEWIPLDRTTTDRLFYILENSELFGESNPMPGLLKALTLPLPQEPDERIHICVIGDEATASMETALRRIDELNPPDGQGGWRATISAVQLPTVTTRSGRMGNTGVWFETMMSTAAAHYGGTFRMLTDVYRP